MLYTRDAPNDVVIARKMSNAGPVDLAARPTEPVFFHVFPRDLVRRACAP